MKTIKTFLINAALKQGISKQTKVTALADGAKNCWSVLTALDPYCGQLECILDWFHIAKKFQPVRNVLGEALGTLLDCAKWKLWHGKVKEALTKLALLRNDVTNAAKRSKLIGLYDYIHRNQSYIINYEERQQSHQTYTSQVAESHVESLINARHKRTGKMQWTRKGAHNVLQIGAKMESNEWNDQQQGIILSALGVAA